MKLPDQRILKQMAENFSYMEKMSEKIFQQMGPIFSMQQRIQDSIRPIVEAQEALQKSLEPFSRFQQQMSHYMKMAYVPEGMLKEFSRVSAQAVEFRRRLENFISPTMIEYAQKAIRELPDRTKKAIAALGNNGWFFDMEMPLSGLWELEKALEEGNSEEAEKALVEYFRKNIKKIEDEAIKAFPNREKILKSAFSAHEREEYELSIPVFLAQADGICNEVINEHLFMRRDRRPQTASYVESLATDTLKAAFLHPLTISLPISASQSERDEHFSDLNRHQVLHGESIDYGTEVNSLKAVSLLNYVVQMLK